MLDDALLERTCLKRVAPGDDVAPRLAQHSVELSDMEQIITPLQWVSTAKPIAAKVRSEASGTYWLSPSKS
ncbi:hypothetical protein [Nocardia sp. NPDC052112]|uniref:hypothetical protein n=1 Tax=Nocardia sp. NPDC052112 TaxID=3155646 RepID=UPI003446C25F